MAPSWRLYVAVVLSVALVAGQVTFSRDWTGGKRSPSALFDCGQFARICRHFLHDLRSAISADGRKQRDPDDLQGPRPDRYDEDE